ncbi:flagellar hook-length control protein FliK [Azospirillum sp. sgz301742]
MEIQPFAPQTTFDTPSVGSSANGPKDDLFAQMMDQASARAAERQSEADKADREKPYVAEPRRWQPSHPAAKPAVDHTPPRSPRADEAHAANDARKDAAPPHTHAEDKIAKPASKDEAPAKPAERTTKAVKPGKTERSDTAHKAAKSEKASGSEAAEKVEAADNTADGADAAETDGSGTGADAPAEASAVADGAVPNGLVVMDAEVTVVETTVQLIGADGSTSISTSVTAKAEVSVEATADPGTVAPAPAAAPAAGAAPNITDPAALALAALQAGASAPAQPQADPQKAQATQAADAVAGAQAAGAPATVTPAITLPTADLTAAAAPTDATPTAKGDAAPVDAKAAAKAATAPADGKTAAPPADAKTAKADATPADAPTGAKNEAKPAKKDAPKDKDDEFKLPDSMADLLGPKGTEKAADKGAAKSHAEAGKDGGTAPQQPPATVQAPPPVQPQRAVGESFTAAAEGAAVDEIAATDSVSASADAPGNKDLGSGQILPTDAVKAAAPADAPPAFAALRPARGPHTPMGVPEQVAVNISRHVAEGNEQFTIMLRPEELGRIDIRLEIGKDGSVSAMVAVDKPQTLELLQRDARGLERALQDAGLKADSGSLNFSLRGDGASSFADQRGDDHRGTGRRGRGFGGGGDDAAEVAAMQTLYLAPGRVDVRV